MNQNYRHLKLPNFFKDFWWDYALVMWQNLNSQVWFYSNFAKSFWDLSKNVTILKRFFSFITINKKKLLNLCSNDYLGLPVTKLTIKQIQSSSRLVSGNDSSFKILETKLAKHKSQEQGLVFPTGYMANLGSITSVIQKGDLILSDERNHASIIEGCRLSGAKISVYKHNDIEDLSQKLRSKERRKFIITRRNF